MRWLLVPLFVLITAASAATQTQIVPYSETHSGTAVCTPTATCVPPSDTCNQASFNCTLNDQTAGILFGPLTTGSPQTPPVTGHAPVVAPNTCNIALPILGQTVVTVGGGSCAYTATCNAVACNGMDAITSWAITAQSTPNAFAISSTGVLTGGSAAGSVTTGVYTVTVTATNVTGTSPGVVQTVNAFISPVVTAQACTIKSPVSNGVNVVLQAGGNCQYTATCGGGACSGGNAISGWAITSQTCTSCYQVTGAGVLQGGANAANVGNTTSTVNVTASNAAGTSPAVAQTVTAILAPVVTNQNFSRNLPIVFPNTIGTMVASANPTSWAITAVTGNGTGAVIGDFTISSAGVIATTASAPTDITVAGTASITVTATNATGTSAPGTATLVVASNPPPLVQAKTCNVTPPVTSGVNVNPACGFSATCGGGGCTGGNGITSWHIVSQTHANGFNITSSGTLQGGSGAINTTGANTVTITATNANGTSPAVGETVNVAALPPVVSNQTYSRSLPLVAGNLTPVMTATNNPTSWAITAVSGAGALARDFTISGTTTGQLALTSFAPTDITVPGTVTINVTATNSGGTSPTATATLTVNAIAAPVVQATSCTITLPVSNGVAVSPSCTFTASCGGLGCSGGSAITAWAITAQSLANAFAISSSGQLLGGIAAGSVVAGNFAVTVTATNAGGTSPGVSQAIVASTCPQGVHAGDGCSGAPAGPPVAAGLFTNGSGGLGLTYSVRPAWNVAGVDYHVGYDTTITLKNPNSGGFPACASVSGTTVTVNSAPCLIEGYDFSVNSGGWHLYIGPSCTGAGNTVTVHNNKFVGGTATGSDFVNMDGASTCAIDLEANTFDGAGCNTFNISQEIAHNGHGALTAQYNQFINSAQHGISLQMPSSFTNMTFISKYNYYRVFGYFPTSHANPFIYNSNAAFVNPVSAYDTIIVPGSGGDPSPVGVCPAHGSIGGASSGNEYWAGISTGAQINHNTLIAPCIPSGSCSQDTFLIRFQGSGSVNTNPVIDSNYMDPSGNISPAVPFDLVNSTGETFTNNINLISGGPCNANNACP